jgi:hypothetical protein
MTLTQSACIGLTAIVVWFLPLRKLSAQTGSPGFTGQDGKEISEGCGPAVTSYPIDMSISGEPSRSRFSRTQRVCVILLNMNPFTTVYRVRTTSASYPQDALSDIPKALGVVVPRSPAPTSATITLGDINSLALASISAPPRKGGKALSESCNKLDTFRRQLTFVAQQKRALDTDLESAITILTVIAAAGDSLYQPSLRAAHLWALSQAFVASFPKPPSDPLVGGFNARASGLQTVSSTLIQQAIQSPRDGTCNDIESEVGELAITLATDLPAVMRAAVTMDDAIIEANALKVLAREVARGPRVLRHTFWIGDFDNPSYVDILVRTAPRPVASARDTLWRTERSPRLYFGDRRQFSVLGGLSFGAEKVAQKYQVVRTAEAPDSRRIELDEETVPIAPMLYASAALARTSRLSLNAVGGVGPTFTQSIKAVLFVGMGVGIADDRVFLLVGGLSAPRTRLTGGYGEGDILPSQQDLVPVKTDRKMKLAFGVAVRPF